MGEPVILPIFCVEFFTGQNAYARERYYPDLNLASVWISERLKFTVVKPRGEIVVYEASVAGRVFLGINIPFLVKGRVCRVVVRTCGD